MTPAFVGFADTVGLDDARVSPLVARHGRGQLSLWWPGAWAAFVFTLSSISRPRRPAAHRQTFPSPAMACFGFVVRGPSVRS